MKLKKGVSLENVYEQLRKEISTHIEVKNKQHLLYKNLRWVEINKDSFVGVKIFLKNDQLLIDSHIPGFFARTYFGGIISGIFHFRARRSFKQKIAGFLISEFYDQ